MPFSQGCIDDDDLTTSVTVSPGQSNGMGVISVLNKRPLTVADHLNHNTLYLVKNLHINTRAVFEFPPNHKQQEQSSFVSSLCSSSDITQHIPATWTVEMFTAIRDLGMHVLMSSLPNCLQGLFLFDRVSSSAVVNRDKHRSLHIIVVLHIVSGVVVY